MSLARTASVPDYELAGRIALSQASQVKALGHPIRTTIWACSTSGRDRHGTGGRPWTAEEHGRPPRQSAPRGRSGAGGPNPPYALSERFYGRTARCLRDVDRAQMREQLPRDFNDFEVAARESAAAYRDGKLWGFIRHVRITDAQASAFWERMAALVAEVEELPRPGDTMYGTATAAWPEQAAAEHEAVRRRPHRRRRKRRRADGDRDGARRSRRRSYAQRPREPTANAHALTDPWRRRARALTSGDVLLPSCRRQSPRPGALGARSVRSSAIHEPSGADRRAMSLDSSRTRPRSRTRSPDRAADPCAR